MEEKLSELINWRELDEIIYAAHNNPHQILGPHVMEEGILINAFIPTAVAVTVKIDKTGKEYEMERADEPGGYYQSFFMVMIPGKRVPNYTLIATYDNGASSEFHDPYAFGPVISEKDQNKFNEGKHYTIYEKLGAHPMEINGVKGVLFAVWAPNAYRVSVVGNFNLWDGRRHSMRKLGNSGIFELFIPDIEVGEIYKYELKVNGPLPMLKADPYGFQSEKRPANASVVCDLSTYEWNDAAWMEQRKKTDLKKKPVAIYEIHLGSWKKPEDGRDFCNYREIAPELAAYVKKMGYTHVELMPIMEHPLDASWGYQVTGYFAATSRYGTPQDFMYFMDYMHQNGIGVILDWVPAHFPRDAFGLANFDGTCLYEHKDPRQGAHPHWGTLIYNYGRPEVSNFLISNALFWLEKYHADGIRMDAVASMLYLDYGKNYGEWVANQYGGNENLEAIEFLRNLNTAVKKRKDGAVMIAEESTAWEKVTGAPKDGGLGFDYKWNMGWMNDFTSYMKADPLFRKGIHNNLTFSFSYMFSEKYVLVLSHDEVVHGKGSMVNKMPGDYESKFANLRAAYGQMMVHPGHKLLFMGQEFAQFDEWSEERELSWELLEYDSHKHMQDYVKALNAFYQKHPALYEKAFEEGGFEWMNGADSERSMLSFARKSADETLLVVCNFTPVVYENYQVGVPFAGKYKEIFNSDAKVFGGAGNGNPRVKTSKEIPVMNHEDSITITVPAMSVIIFSAAAVEKKADTKKKAGRKPAAKRQKTEEETKE
ncbi:MAG: 1,4-alpha-glucan branching protein GlgB [Lachnospiraceae bacterium]|nr:1,4-alpha-glucan branching protein GlgB [Lachnospiraceae bacterium]